jgi:hypothetical protein
MVIYEGFFESMSNKLKLCARTKELDGCDSLFGLQQEVTDTVRTDFLRGTGLGEGDKNEKLSAKARVVTIFPSVDVVCQFGRCRLRR